MAKKRRKKAPKRSTKKNAGPPKGAGVKCEDGKLRRRRSGEPAPG